MPPKVTIGFPVHNGERYLSEALESLVKQNVAEFEIIVSNNASTDGTGEILDDFRSRYSFIKIYNQEQLLDATDNFLFVLEKAKGEYFCWHAHDDLRSPGEIASLTEVLDSHPEIVCAMSDVVNLYEDQNRRVVEQLDSIRLDKVIRDWRTVRRHFFEVPTSNIFFCIYGLYRTDVLRRVKIKMNLGFSANNEIPMLAQVALLGRIASIANEGFIYRRHDQSIYHQEVAEEGPGVQIHRNKVIRRVLRKMVLSSTLPVLEKIFFLLKQIAEWNKDRQSKKEYLAGPKRRKKKMRKKKMRKFIKRVRNRLRNRIFGAAPSQKKRKGKVREDATEKIPLSDEELALARVDPESSTFNGFVRRESARRRLESKGWRFAQDKGISLLFEHGITSVIDCGANCGQFVENLRESGWSGQVHSFEPLPGAYAILSEKAQGFNDWRTFPFALGEVRGEAEIKVAGNSYSSSLLEFTADFKELLPEAVPVSRETIQVVRLDEFVAGESLNFSGPIMLKLDVQGFELQVMRGAGDFLNRICLVQTELAFVPSYDGAPVFADVKQFLNDRGFALVHLMDGHANHLTGELREVDGFFVNTKLSNSANPS